MLTFSRTEYPIDSVFLLQDLDTQRIYQLHGLSMPSSSGPSWPTVERARSKGACRLDVVIESVSWTSNMPSFPPFLFMSTAQEGRLSSKRRFPELGTYAPALLNPVSRRSVRRHRNRGSYRPQNRAKCGHFIPGLTLEKS